MTLRKDRYLAAVDLAQLILQDIPDRDDFLIEQALQDLKDEVAAGRRNQEEWPIHVARAQDLAGHSMRTPGPVLTLVEGDK